MYLLLIRGMLPEVYPGQCSLLCHVRVESGRSQGARLWKSVSIIGIICNDKLFFLLIGTIAIIGYRFDQKAYRFIGIGIGSQKLSIFYRNLPIISYR